MVNDFFVLHELEMSQMLTLLTTKHKFIQQSQIIPQWHHTSRRDPNHRLQRDKVLTVVVVLCLLHHHAIRNHQVDLKALDLDIRSKWPII